MGIHFVTGRPGAGKGLYAMRLVIEELRSTNRPIITNFPLLKDKLAEYMDKEYGESFDILTRVILLETKSDLSNFYRVRKENKDGTLHFLDTEEDSKGKPVSYDIDGAQDGGVYYLLDEVHIVFGARDWQDMGRAILFYASQHRKLGDDVILISQVPKNVDSQFRGIAQDFSVLRNHGMEKFLIFKQPSMFARHTYMNMPTGANSGDSLEQSYFKLNLDQANCYETARGVGLGPKDGATADKGKDRRKGLHIFWVIPIMILIGGGLVFGLKYAAGAGASALSSSGQQKLATVADKSRKNLGLSVTNVVDKPRTNRVQVAAPVTEEKPKPELERPAVAEEPERATILSYTLRPVGDGFEFSCYGSDGRRYSLKDKTLKSVGSEFVTTEDDEKIYFKNHFDLPRVLRDVESGRRSRQD